MALVAHFFEACLPSFLGPPVEKKQKVSSNTPSTQYLDGLRGLVAISVFIQHFSLPWQDHLYDGYGFQGHRSVLRLPIVRALYVGPLVPIFFVINGYVLSLGTFKPTTVMSPSTSRGLAASCFRRSMRLFMLPIVSSFAVLILVRLGLFSFPYDEMPGRTPDYPQRLETFPMQLRQWLLFVTQELVNPWRWDIPSLLYGPHLWTIPVSFKGSMAVYLSCLMLLYIKARVRIAILLVTILYALVQTRWDMVPFFGGMILCQLDMLYPISTTIHNSHQRLAKTVFWFCILLAGLYVGSFPITQKPERCVSQYRWLCNITPRYMYWHDLAAFLIVLAVCRETLLQRFFNSRVLQYFGKISFSFYIVHEPLLHVFGFYTVPFTWSLIGNKTHFQYQFGLLTAMSITGFVTTWVADRCKYVVEDTLTRISRWIERVCDDST